eukprot:804815-Pelagomonas_calceolata.AAC.13
MCVPRAPEHDVDEGGPVHRLRLKLQPVGGLDMGHCQHHQQHKGHQDGQAAGHQAVAHDGEAPEVHVGQH